MSAEPLTPPTDPPPGPSRRTTLKKGLAVGGAAMWAVPSVQALTVTSASAQRTSAPPPPPPPPPPPAEPTGKYISHGFVLVLCAGKYYSAKVESNGSVDGSGNQDREYLAGLGYTDIARGVPAGFVGSRSTFEGELALKLVVPSTCSIVEAIAVSFDGSFDDDGPGPQDKFAPATVVGNTVYFRVSDDDD